MTSNPRAAAVLAAADAMRADALARGPVADDAAPTIAERRNPRTGREEFRAYPHGTEHPDGGAGPWTPDRDAAAATLAAALAVDVNREHADQLAAELAAADWREAAKVRDETTWELWRTRGEQDTSPRRSLALTRRAVAVAELARRSDEVTGYSITGSTARLAFMADGRSGTAWVTLDKDPGIGSMTYPDAIESWTITGGNVDTLRAIVAWGRGRIERGPWYGTGAPGAVAFRAWVDDVEQLADELAGAGR